ncbi:MULTISPECIES: LuxR C-terminal-related transcriptional regulator [Arthrobacter]|uniref:LuxR C-terminal-related transcriptional regulator n=2 Tax=Arthrobacter TaxID=1663 RepID=A0ABU9KKD5_9MICC|nr:LuxR C-terminal-related transcriptional regulator [Arthrobacter sp. YJM1]MDP5227361.1 LuxR C-terminal-related transcriptional regulator [Arthrobacter sp. YJM1]
MSSGTLPTGRIPAPVSRFIGRDGEVRAVLGALAGYRLVTLTGPGGSGKTRLAIEAARQDRRRVVYVDLTGLPDGAPIAPAVSEAAGLRGATGPGALSEVAWWLDSGEPRLLVLDNAEDVLAPVTEFATVVLTQVESVTLMLTSRRPAGVVGEHLVLVGPLSDDDAERLFWDRARSVRPAFPDDEGARSAARELCRRLDRLPLALELAAARMKVLTPGEMLPLLEGSFEALGVNSANPERHRTLTACIEASTRELSPHLASVLVNASVFASPFSASSAADVAGATLSDLEDLVSRSLLQTSTDRGATRFRELESVRDFARSRMAAPGELAAARDRHLNWLHRRFGSGVYPSVMQRSGYASATDLLPELRTALDHALAADVRRGMELLAATGELWFRVAQDECLQRTGRFLTARPDPDEARGAVLLTRVWMLISNQRWEDALEALAEALRLLPADGDAAASAHFFGAVANFLAGHFDASRDSGARALERYVALGDVAGQSRAIGTRGTGLVLAGRNEEGLAVLERALSLAEEAGDVWSQGQIQTYAGLAVSELGRTTAARRRLFDAIDRFRRIGDISLMGIALGRLASLALTQDLRAALRAAGSASRRQGAGGRYHPVTMKDMALIRETALRALPAAEVDALWAAGERLAFADAADELRAVDARSPGDLTPRETEVAALVADGLSNAAIAHRLVLSERTVENHVGRAMAKAEVGNRTALAAWFSGRSASQNPRW